MGDETLWMGDRTIIDSCATRFEDILDRWVPTLVHNDQEDDIRLLPKEVKDASNIAITSPMINSSSLLRVHELSLLELAESVADKTLKCYLRDFLVPEDYDLQKLETMNRLQLLGAITRWRAKV